MSQENDLLFLLPSQRYIVSYSHALSCRHDHNLFRLSATIIIYELPEKDRQS